MCPVCRGRGEVEAGITGGTVEFGPVLPGLDWRGNVVPTRASYPTKVRPNPAKTIWYLETNPFVELWGIAVCATCHGTGFFEGETH